MAIRLTRKGVRNRPNKRLNSFQLFQPRRRSPPQPASCARTCSPLLLLARLFLCYPRPSSTLVPLVFARRRPYLLVFSASCLPWVTVVLFILSFFLEEDDSCCGPFFFKENGFCCCCCCLLLEEDDFFFFFYENSWPPQCSHFPGEQALSSVDRPDSPCLKIF